MPPRFAYWTILAGGLPTAFRAVSRDELLPTFQRLREKHPDAVLKWFARGRLWESPEEARADLERKRQPSGWRRDRPAGAPSARGPRRDEAPGGQGRERRDRAWRPGGDHRDPRQKFADAKKARNAAQRKQRFERKHGSPARPHDAHPHAKPSQAPRGPRPSWRESDKSGGGHRSDGERRPPSHHGTDRGAGGKTGGPHADRPRPFTSGTGTRNLEPGTKDRYRDDAKAGGARAFEQRTFNRKHEARERPAPPRDTKPDGGSPDKPAAPGARPGRRPDERKRRFPRS